MSCAIGLPSPHRALTHAHHGKQHHEGFPTPRRASGSRWWTLCLTLLTVICHPLAAKGYTPDDPQVIAMVERGIAYLEKLGPKQMEGVFSGGPLLVGYTVYKVTADKENPLVKSGVRMALQRAIDVSTRAGANDKIVYEAAVSVLLLADIDAVAYRSQLVQFREFFRNAQKNHGGFGYLSNPRGDTSQTQYAMLALWTLQKNEIDVPTEMIDSLVRYLLSTQDPRGGWGYMGVVAPGNQPVAQEAVTKSLSTAGIGATLIGADVLGLLGKRSMVEDDPDVPKAFVRVDLLQKDRERIKKNPTSTRMEDIETAAQRAADYHRLNPVNQSSEWHFYFRYSEERYESFLEVMKGKGREKSPAWYDAGVNELKRLQDTQGAWGLTSRDSCPPEVCTAFAILYLIRSTQKTIAKLNEGVLAGGYGLPSNAGSVKRVGNRIVSEETASVDSLLEQMEKNNTDNVEMGLLPENLSLSKDAAVRKAQVSRLSRLLSSKDWKSRRIAARLLGRSEDINQVPELIYALTDADSEVPVLAEESLRLLTRKLTERHVELDSTPQQKSEAAEYWRKWYQSMRPDYVFLEK